MNWKLVANDWKDRTNKKGYWKVYYFADNILRGMWFAGTLPNPSNASYYYYKELSVVSDKEGDKSLETTLTMVNDENKEVTATFTFKAGIIFRFTVELEDDRWGYYVDECYIEAPFDIEADFVDKNVSVEERAEMFKMFYSIMRGEKK